MWFDVETQARINIGLTLKRQEAATDTSKFAEFRAFRVDPSWYEAYWFRQDREHSARLAARSIVNLFKACFALGRVRRAAAVMPAEGSPCFGDDVSHARRLLLNEQ